MLLLPAKRVEEGVAAEVVVEGEQEEAGVNYLPKRGFL